MSLSESTAPSRQRRPEMADLSAGQESRQDKRYEHVLAHLPTCLEQLNGGARPFQANLAGHAAPVIGRLSARAQIHADGTVELFGQVLSAFGASGASARLMPTKSCIMRRRSSPAAQPRAARG